MPAKPTRALVIAIENYPKAEGLSRKLEGTTDAAARFCKWLVDTRKVAPENIAICAEKELIPGQPFTGTTLGDILDALTNLITSGKDKTADFFFLFSGHGFCWEKSSFVQATDVLVASDFKNRKVSGRACFEFAELRELLRLLLGGKQHFFFTDACRTILKEGEIQVGALGLALERALQGTPEVYTMFSAAVGDAAFTMSGFSPSLVAGLNGEGHAKGWVKNKMYVKFDLLRDYIRNRTNTGVDALSGGPGLIHELGPVQVPCTITVNDAKADDQFQGTLKTGELSTSFQFQGPSTSIPLAPAERGYEFTVTFGGAPLTQTAPPPDTFLDLFEPCSLTFRKGPGVVLQETVRGIRPRPVAPEPPPPPLTVAVDLKVETLLDAKGTSIRMVSPRLGEVARSRRLRLVGDFQPGDYIAEVRYDGKLLSQQSITLESGQPFSAQLDVPLSNWLLDRIRDRLPAQWTSSVEAMSKELGPAAANDVSLWVALMASAEIVNPTIAEGGFAGLHLLKGERCAKGHSMLLVLAASENSKRCRVAIGGDKKADWQTMEPVPELPGLFRYQEIQERGPQLVSFRLPKRPAWTFSTFGLPNRVTLVVLGEDAAGNVSARQFLLPVRSLFRHLPDVVYEKLDRETARMVQLISWQQARFESGQKFEGTKDDLKRWDDLLHAKWLDPLLTLIAAHEIVRAGQVEAKHDVLETVEANMTRYFRGIPDTLVLSSFLGKKIAKPQAPPMLRESLMSLPAFFDVLPFPREKLDHDSMWVSWRDAVR